jgi:hypothetical protein
MGHQATIYGIDIEIDTRSGRLDPAVAPVRTVALCGRSFDEIFTGDEAALLRDLDHRLRSLAPGVLATWNGGVFDLPFLADRAALVGVELGLQLQLDRRLTLHRRPLPGHPGAYRGAWGAHGHLDTFRLYGQSGPSPWTSLRTIGRLLGLNAPGGPADRTHDLLSEAFNAHAASDARLARVLAERRWSAAHRLVDRLEPDPAPVDLTDRRAGRTGDDERVRPLRPAGAGL